MLPETQFLVRAFPSPNKDWNNVKLDANQKLIYVRSLEDLRRGKSGSNIYWQFKVDDIFVNTSQEEYYRAIVTKELLQKVLTGNDVMILCFGSSGTGKSYSAFGMYNRFEYRGIAPRLLEDIFKLKDENAGKYKTDISLAHVEIIGKNIHNLLVKGKPVILKSGRKAYHGFGTRLENICQGMKLIFEGDERRNFENETSHCGTTILTYDITCASLLPTNPFTAVGRIHLVDTAGTDYGSSPTKSRKCHIDANLTKCEINTLCSWHGNSEDPKKNFLRRGSTLALYLGTSISNSYSRLLGHIKTTREDLANSMSTLLFGTRLRRLHSPLLVQARIKNSDLIIKGLQNEIREIKDNIMADKLVKSVFMPDTISQDHMEYILREIHAFCQSSGYQPSVLLAKAHPVILMLGFREIYNRDIEGLKDYYERELEAKEKVEQEKLKNKRPSTSLTSIHRNRSPNTEPATTPVPVPAPAPPPPVTLELKTPYVVDDQSKDMDSQATGEENYARTLSEYMNRSTTIKLKIKLYELDIDECFKAKCRLQSKLTDLKQKIEALRLELKKEEWNTFLKKLETNIYTREGKALYKSPEQEKLETEIEVQVNHFNQTRSSLYNIHNRYMAANEVLNDIKTNIQKEFNEYVKLMLGNTLILPPAEISSQIKCKALQQQEEEKKVIDRVAEAEQCFENLQRKPLKKSVKNP